MELLTRNSVPDVMGNTRDLIQQQLNCFAIIENAQRLAARDMAAILDLNDDSVCLSLRPIGNPKYRPVFPIHAHEGEFHCILTMSFMLD